MTTIIIDPTNCPTTSAAAIPGARRTAAMSAISRPRRLIPAWLGDVIGVVRRFLPTQSETPSDQAISTLSQGDRLGERR